MNAQWLDQLAPEHAPPPPPWWPPAVGWWIAAATCVVLVAALAAWRRFSAHAPARRLRRAAFSELAHIRSYDDDGAAARDLQRLLRRYALAVFGADRVAPLAGDAWLDFLARHGAEGLAGDSGRQLLGAAFGNRAAAQRESWLAAAEAFIRDAPRRVGAGEHAP
jgi:hypothetical protein